MEKNIHMILVGDVNLELLEDFIEHVQSNEAYIVRLHRGTETGIVQRIEIELKEEE